MEEQLLEIKNCPVCGTTLKRIVNVLGAGGVRLCTQCEWMGYAAVFIGVKGCPDTYPCLSDPDVRREVGKA